MLDFLTNVNWLSPIAIGIYVLVVAIGGYLWWAWSEKQWPFSQ